MHSQGTPPGNCNPIVYETKKVQHQLSAHDRIVVPEMNPVPKELSGDEHQEAVFVYQNPCTRTYVTPDNDEGDDELAEEKITPLNVNDVKEKQLPSYDHKKYKCTDREMMYTSKVCVVYYNNYYIAKFIII